MFEPKAWRKQLQARAELILGASRGHFKSRGLSESVPSAFLHGVVTICYRVLRSQGQEQLRLPIRTWDLPDSFPHFSYRVFEMQQILLFTISYINCKTRILVWIQTLKSSTWLLCFSMPLVTKKVAVTAQWLVARSNCKPVKDAGMTWQLNFPSTLFYLHFLCPKLCDNSNFPRL